ncbi:sensor domain-containing protein [Martelella endophytica]|uniref:sensor domain-containing protein n=1 Tax=Martelella endophytica TaxID=1486262 RepID=UPI000698908E|nr:bifunctional diguanylate cyclase/phosphodiesterase [Martelella endophytica]
MPGQTLGNCAKLAFAFCLFIVLFTDPASSQTDRKAFPLPALFEKSPVAMLVVDPGNGRILATNPAAQALYGWDAKAFSQLYIFDLNQMSRERINDYIEQVISDQKHDFVVPHRFADGSVHAVRLLSWATDFDNRRALLSLVTEDGSQPEAGKPAATYSKNLEDAVRAKSAELDQSYSLLTLTLSVAIAVLAAIVVLLVIFVLRRRHLVRELARQHLLLRVVIDAIPDQIYFKRSDGRLAACNQAAAEFVGKPAEMIIGKTDVEIFGNSNDALLKQQVFSEIDNEEEFVSQGEVASPTGRKYALEMIKAPVIDAGGERLGTVNVWRDISERRQIEARIESLAFYDPLTKLANRAKAHDVLIGFLASHRQQNQYLALVIFDVDNFAAVNSIFGHNVGDGLLRIIGTRLKDNIGAGSFAARLSSDEFLVLLSGLGTDPETARERAQAKLEALIEALSQLAVINTSHITPSTCAGAVMVGDDAMGAEEVLRRADLAMHAAKRRGRGQLSWFDNNMDDDLVERFDLETALGQALANDGFRLYLQPKVYLNTSERHFEVLLRLQHHERGTISPGGFIDVAESTGMIVPIGAWVLEEAAQLLCKHPNVHLSVNVSVQQLLQVEFVDGLAELLQRYPFDPSHLTLEMTESLMIANFELALSQLRKIRALRVRLSIDDFGTGYSALVYLKQLPIDELKIDQTFIAGLPDESNDSSLVELIIATAHHLGLSIVAEGVETPEQEAWLRERGCECLQGYLFDEPRPVAFYLS